MRAAGGFENKVTVPKGEPANFLTEAELRAKFAGLANPVLGQDRSAQLADAALAIDSTADIAMLMRHGSPLELARMAAS